MAERMIDRYLGFMPESSRDAFLRMAGNFGLNSVSENLLKAYAHELEGVNPADFELAVKRVIATEHIVHFPRWSEFKRYLPMVRGECQSMLAWYDAYSGTWGGPWPEPGARLNQDQIDRTFEVREAVAKIHAGQRGKPWDYQSQQREALLKMLDGILGKHAPGAQGDLEMSA